MAAYSMGTNFVNNAVSPYWTETKMHQKNGNVLIVDGSAQQYSSAKMRDALRTTGDTGAGGNPGPGAGVRHPGVDRERCSLVYAGSADRARAR